MLALDCAAVATSGARRVASARLAAAGLSAPAVMVTADDVRDGKPAPCQVAFVTRETAPNPLVTAFAAAMRG